MAEPLTVGQKRRRTGFTEPGFIHVTSALAGRDTFGVGESNQSTDVRELERTVAAMREALEQKDRDAAADVQRVLVDSASELAELKATVNALREQLETQERAHVAQIQETERLHRSVVRELEETVRELRAKIGTADV